MILLKIWFSIQRCQLIYVVDPPSRIRLGWCFLRNILENQKLLLTKPNAPKAHFHLIGHIFLSGYPIDLIPQVLLIKKFSQSISTFSIQKTKGYKHNSSPLLLLFPIINLL